VTTTAFHIKPASASDVPLIRQLISELAEYEKLSHAMQATEERLATELFGPRPAAEVLLAYAGAEPAGFALYFQNFSTFVGKPGLYLEDLFVRPAWRGRGLGRLLLTRLAEIAVERDYGRMEWTVIDWNESAIGFYRRLGARTMDEWILCRLTGDELRQLATDKS
jgi:GNAT superfamily N-acetyltransferase